MIQEEMKAIIEKRKALDIHDEPSLINSWKQEIKVLSNDLADCIDYTNNCSDEDFNWISEVFDDLIEITQSRTLLDAIYQCADRIADADIRSSIATDISYAAEQLE